MGSRVIAQSGRAKKIVVKKLEGTTRWSLAKTRYNNSFFAFGAAADAAAGAAAGAATGAATGLVLILVLSDQNM